MPVGDPFGRCACGGELRVIEKTIASVRARIALDAYNVRQKVSEPVTLRVGKCLCCRAEYGEGFRPEDRAAAKGSGA